MSHQNSDISKIGITSSFFIDDTSQEGVGIAHHDGITVFVEGAVVGDTVEAVVTAVEKRFLRAETCSVVHPSPYRIPLDCPDFHLCGGCAYRTTTYAAELELKSRRVRETLRRIGGLSPEILPIIPSDSIDRYRNNIQLHMKKEQNGQYSAGFFQKRSHQLLTPRDCYLMTEKTKATVALALKLINQCPDSFPMLTEMQVRETVGNGEMMVRLHTEKSISQESAKKLISELGVESLVISNHSLPSRHTSHFYGKETISDTLCGLHFTVGADTFYQINSLQAKQLYEKALSLANLNGNETVLDLYCGVGTISQIFAVTAKQVIGVEINRHSVENARECVKINNLENIQFICADTESAVSKLAEDGIQMDIVILDPPRAGCGKKLIEQTVQFVPSRIIYISCDPATLARDLKLFASHGYETLTVQPVDMFPRTSHVECVILMSRVGDGKA